MNNPTEKYCINDNPFSKKELLRLAKSEIENKDNEAWKIEIYSLIHEWLSDGDFISVLTSGSTGKPKIIKFKKWQLIESARRTGKYFKLKKGGKALLCLPANNIAGKMMIIRAFILGMKLHFIRPVGNPFKEINCKFDFVAMTPLQVSKSIVEGEDLNMIKTIIIGGGKISNSLISKLQKIKTNCYATYGMTETITHIAIQRLNGINKKDSFKLLPDILIRTDSRGCLCIKAPYLKYEVITNDLVSIIDSEHFAFKGRFDNVINSGGIKIFPEEIENLIEEIIESPFYISSEPDDDLGDKLILMIEGDEQKPPVIQEIMKKLKRILSPYQIPKDIIFKNQFRRTINGKIIRQ